MDVLRARAFLDLVLSKDSRPGAEPTAKPSPGGFAGRATLTVPPRRSWRPSWTGWCWE